jgi:hypothetical protein
MSDTQTTVLLVGAVVALARAIEWLAKAGMKPHKTNGSSGQQSPAYWELTIGNIVEKKLTDHESKVREIIRQELERK